MAKKKNMEPITGFGRDPENKLTVLKSRPLFALWRSELSLSEFKILDAYLSRIDSHKPEKRSVVFTKGELEHLLGSRINHPDLEQRLRNLYQPIDLANGDKKRIHLVGLFEEAAAEQDEDGLWQVKLTCTVPAMKYIFNVDEIGYLRYKLRCITNLTSRYSYILFTYLEANRFRKTWEVSLDELKEILNCEEDASYNEFKIFNQQILKRCQKELHEKTECRFAYEPVRKGRKVASIKFELETIEDLLEELDEDVIPGQLSMDDILDDVADERSATFEFLSGACDDEFSQEEMEAIFAIIADKDLPEHKDGVDFARYHYLSQKYALLKVRAAKNAAAGKPIKNRFSYFKTMLEKD